MMAGALAHAELAIRGYRQSRDGGKHSMQVQEIGRAALALAAWGMDGCGYSCARTMGYLIYK